MVKKVIRTALIAVLLFLVFVVLFSLRLNRRETAEVSPAEQATLPVAFMQVNGTAVNEMFGMRQELSEEDLRESLTPLPANRSLELLVNTEGENIRGISYQVTEPADGTLVENGQITDLQETDQQLTASFTLQGNLRNGQEYTLRFSLDLGGDGTVYYYTRLVQGNGVDMTDYLNFAGNFVSMCLDKSQTDSLAAYLEPDDTAANRSYTDVNIHSSTDMVSWGSLSPEEVKEPVPVIREVNATTASVEMDYVISSDNSNQETEYYFVRDFFRMGHQAGGQAVTLLNFNRSAELLFDGSHQVETDTGLNLGVQNRNVQYRTNQEADIAAFVLNGNLWQYNRNTGRVTKVFSFLDESGKNWTPDERTAMTGHGISVEHVSETGDITFVVYGYMASGIHEGYMGVSVCSYSAETNQAEERVFIPIAQSFACLEENISKLSYVTTDGGLYLFLGNELCRINMADGSYSVVQDAISADGFVSSDSQQTVAWAEDGNSGTSGKATLMDLSDGKTAEIDAPEGEGIVVCGFLNEDLVYGLVRREDILKDSSGRNVCGMHELRIQGMDGKVKKTYTRDGAFVTGVTEESDGLELSLASQKNGSYADAGTDHIMNNDRSAETVTVDTRVYDRSGENILLNFTQTAEGVDLSYQRADIRYANAGSVVLEWPDVAESAYYVYGEGDLEGTYEAPNIAIQAADAVSGVVLNRKQQYVWVRGDWGTSYTIDSGTLPAGVLSAGMDADALSDLLGKDYEVMDLTGVTQEDLKYQIARGYPVLAQGDGQVYCIIGYDAYNIWVYDEETKAPRAIASDDSEAEFTKNGNRFLSYRQS